jgi:hypothetical protein
MSAAVHRTLFAKRSLHAPLGSVHPSVPVRGYLVTSFNEVFCYSGVHLECLTVRIDRASDIEFLEQAQQAPDASSASVLVQTLDVHIPCRHGLLAWTELACDCSRDIVSIDDGGLGSFLAGEDCTIDEEGDDKSVPSAT